MSRRKHLTAAQKRDALMQCDNIAGQLRKLAMGVLNGHSRIVDTEHALRMAASVERLRDRIWRYPVTRNLPSAKPPQRRARMIDRN